MSNGPINLSSLNRKAEAFIDLPKDLRTPVLYKITRDGDLHTNTVHKK
jgi:hypothetical protein